MIVERLERPTASVVDLQEVALHTRADGIPELLPELQRFADAAVREAEDWAQIALLSQAVRITLDGWPRAHSFRLPIGPLLDWASVTVTADGQAFEDFTITTGQRPELRVTAPLPCGRLVVEYVAGYGETANTIPDDLRLAVMDQAACYFDARGATDSKTRAQSPHFARIVGRYRGVRA